MVSNNFGEFDGGQFQLPMFCFRPFEKMWLIPLFILALLGIDGPWKLPRVTPSQPTMRRLQRTACTMTEGWILRSHAQELGAPRSGVWPYDCVAAKVRPHHQIPKKEYEHWSQGPQSPLRRVVDSSCLDHWNPLAHGSWQSPKWLILDFMKASSSASMSSN